MYYGQNMKNRNLCRKRAHITYTLRIDGA